MEQRWLLSTCPYYILSMYNKEFIMFPSCAMSKARFCYKKLAALNKHIKGKMITKMSLNEFFVFILESVYFICCCSVTDTMISLVAHKLHKIPMSNQAKFTARSSKLKTTQSKFANNIIVSCSICHINSLFFFSFFCFLPSYTFDYAGGWVNLAWQNKVNT